MSNTKIKFNFEDKETLDMGVKVLVRAYRFYENGYRQMIECVEKAMRGVPNKYRLPGNEALRDALKDIIGQMDAGKLMDEKAKRSTARTWVINEALKELGIKEPEPEKEEPAAEEQIQGQICMELPEAETKKAEEPLDMTPLMRLIAGKAGNILEMLEQLHQDITKMDDHLCQVLRRTVG